MSAAHMGFRDMDCALLVAARHVRGHLTRSGGMTGWWRSVKNQAFTVWPKKSP
ncbi:MAG: hypothetical protein OXD33_03990 [Rhodobacteraceae bacterium]|nr:hypothetical protein [Paracoccaceae bacterium]